MGTNKSKKEKRFEKFVEKQVKKEERVGLMEKLSSSSWKSGLMRSSKTLGRMSETKREKLHRAATEEKLGMDRSDPSVRLYVSERDSDEVRRQAEAMAVVVPVAGKKRRRKAGNKGSTEATATPPEVVADQDDVAMVVDTPMAPVSEPIAVVEDRAPGSALASTVIVKRKRQKKGRVLQKLGLVEALEELESESESEPELEPESDFDSSASESDTSEGEEGEEDRNEILAETETATATANEIEAAPSLAPQKKKEFYTGSMLKPLLAKRGLISEDSGAKGKEAYYVAVDRPSSIQEQRTQLPVYAEEQQIMEAITENPVVVLSGETGSGKTTQVPQFLFEAGYGDPGSSNPGMIGITQPRRVAAISMAHRVAEELGGYGETVAHQVRFDSCVSDKTRVKFMTEGVLLRELAGDLLLTKYSVVIADEAHERSLNTDILLGVLSRVVRLRHKLALESPAKHRPLKLVIMSATLRVDDFVKNARLFPVAPPVISVQARQHAVRVHFNRRTPAPGQHVGEVVAKVAKIHRRLPDGGILVFLTGQAEIVHVCKKLRELFPTLDERRALEEAKAAAANARRKPKHGRKH
ncbi:putative ATP-dependent RNA helicase DHR1, partial [Coemansia aciculifera]